MRPHGLNFSCTQTMADEIDAFPHLRSDIRRALRNLVTVNCCFCLIAGGCCPCAAGRGSSAWCTICMTASERVAPVLSPSKQNCRISLPSKRPLVCIQAIVTGKGNLAPRYRGTIDKQHSAICFLRRFARGFCDMPLLSSQTRRRSCRCTAEGSPCLSA